MENNSNWANWTAKEPKLELLAGNGDEDLLEDEELIDEFRGYDASA